MIMIIIIIAAIIVYLQQGDHVKLSKGKKSEHSLLKNSCLNCMDPQASAMKIISKNQH